MSYEVRFSRAARKQLGRVHSEHGKRIVGVVEALGDDPHPRGAEPVKNTPGYLRVRVGEYRIIYDVRDEALVVLVIRIGHRKEVYRNL